MFETAVITLREGIEAFLIVAITLAYLRKTGRGALASAVYWGTGSGLAASVLASRLFMRAANQPFWEGLLAALATVLVASMVIYMLKAARHLKSTIAARIEAAAERPGAGAFVAIFVFVLIMITREGMETALLITTLMFQVGAEELLSGALLGLTLAGMLAWAWGHWGHLINLGRFFQVTSLFLGLFCIQLLLYAFHEFTEAGTLPIDNAYWHMVSEPYGPEGPYGQWLTYLMVLIPAGWLLIAGLKGSRGPRGPGAAHG
jgi:high-affinity iron transporter